MPILAPASGTGQALGEDRPRPHEVSLVVHHVAQVVEFHSHVPLLANTLQMTAFLVERARRLIVTLAAVTSPMLISEAGYTMS